MPCQTERGLAGCWTARKGWEAVEHTLMRRIRQFWQPCDAFPQYTIVSPTNPQTVLLVGVLSLWWELTCSARQGRGPVAGLKAHVSQGWLLRSRRIFVNDMWLHVYAGKPRIIWTTLGEAAHTGKCESIIVWPRRWRRQEAARLEYQTLVPSPCSDSRAQQPRGSRAGISLMRKA